MNVERNRKKLKSSRIGLHLQTPQLTSKGDFEERKFDMKISGNKAHKLEYHIDSSEYNWLHNGFSSIQIVEISE